MRHINLQPSGALTLTLFASNRGSSYSWINLNVKKIGYFKSEKQVSSYRKNAKSIRSKIFLRIKLKQIISSGGMFLHRKEMYSIGIILFR